MTNNILPELGLTDVSAAATNSESGAGCACCAVPASVEASEAVGVAEAAADASGATRTLQVAGMTCGHCVSSVTAELSALDGVSSVDVALVAGGVSTVTVHSDAELDAATVAAAIDEAGYSLAN